MKKVLIDLNKEKSNIHPLFKDYGLVQWDKGCITDYIVVSDLHYAEDGEPLWSSGTYFTKIDDALVNLMKKTDQLLIIGNETIAEEVVRADGLDLRFVPSLFITEELCCLAVADEETAMQYVPEEMREDVKKTLASEYNIEIDIDIEL